MVPLMRCDFSPPVLDRVTTGQYEIHGKHCLPCIRILRAGPSGGQPATSVKASRMGMMVNGAAIRVQLLAKG